MAAIDFPADVPINYEFTPNTITYVWDGTTWNIKSSNLLYNFNDNKKGFAYYDDFLTNISSSSTPPSLNAFGAGAIDSAASTSSNHPGVILLNGSNGTTGTRSAILSTSQPSIMTLNYGVGNSFCESSISIPVLSVLIGNSGARFIITSGFSNASVTYTSHTSGVYFAYDINGTLTGTPSTYWQAVVQNAGSITSTVTSVLVSANTWYKLTVNTSSTTTSGTPGDPASTSSNTAKFYINDVLVASPSTANFPTGYTATPQICCHSISSSSSTPFPSKLNADYLYFGQNFNEVAYR
jgi:hypothetical protein